MTPSEIVERFDGVKPCGADKWQAKCPAHEDRKPSLSITATADKTLMYCQAGCSLHDVCRAVGLTTADLFDAQHANTTNGTTPHIVATYDYTDEMGVLLYQAVRYDPKDFRQRRPDGAGGWIGKLGDTRRVLFALPALQDKPTVVIVEGEKDVATAGKWHLPATCNAGGAGKWRSKYTDQLVAAGCKRVVVIPDNDIPGRAHADTVARSCAAAGLRVQIVTLDVGKDLTEYVAAGKSKADLAALVTAAPDFDPASSPPLGHESNERYERTHSAAHSDGFSTNKPTNEYEQTSGDSDFFRATSFVSSSSAIAWPVLGEDAYHGLIGQIVRAIEPSTEADPAAMLVQVLVLCGNAIGRSPYFEVGADRHHGNEFVVVVGETANGRKGTGFGEARRIPAEADPEWASTCIQGGLSSGEGLVWAVRDDIPAEPGTKQKGTEGIADKRLMIYETEYARLLAVMTREGNTISTQIRQAWDTGDIRIMTKANPAKATGAHISLIGHITQDELIRQMGRVELANGFANRSLFALSKRSKFLPDGGRVDPVQIAGLVRLCETAFMDARRITRVTRDGEASVLWRAVYPALVTGHPGLFGAVRARAEAHVLRLALVYAVLDGSSLITAQHLRAALAVWDYCEHSAAVVFGERVGNPLADYILTVLRERPDGVTRTQLHNLLGRNKGKDEIDTALGLLLRYGLARRVSETSAAGGRPAERWFAVTFGQAAESEVR